MTDKIDRKDEDTSPEEEILEEGSGELEEGEEKVLEDEDPIVDDGDGDLDDDSEAGSLEGRKLTKKHKIILSSICILAIIFGSGLYYLNGLLKNPAIYEGIKIENIDIGGKSKQEAIKLLQDKKELEIDDSKMELSYGDSKYHIQIRDLGFKYDYEKAVDQAHSLARKGKNIDRLKAIRALKKNKKNIELESTYDKEKAQEVIAPIRDEINREKVEASYKFNGGNPEITDEVIGRQIDEEQLKELINNNVYELKPIEIPVNNIEPVRTRAALERINGIIGEFKTNFPNSSPGRKENIQISAQAVSNRGVIMPGETASFNEMTGARSKANGYKEAIVIEEGNYTDGVGGGVCQTSTTLYNALLRADLTIVARGPHSIPAKYVPYGQDAAVAYDYLDLKFKNDFDFPIYINSIYTGSSVIFQVYGDKNVKNYGVEIASETVETVPSQAETVVDNSLAPGQKEVVQYGRTGYKVNTYKSIVRDGKAEERKLITRDYYRPKNTVYRVGPSAD